MRTATSAQYRAVHLLLYTIEHEYIPQWAVLSTVNVILRPSGYKPQNTSIQNSRRLNRNFTFSLTWNVTWRQSGAIPK